MRPWEPILNFGDISSKHWKFQKTLAGALGTFFEWSKWYQWISLKVPEGLLQKKILGGPNSKLVPIYIKLVKGLDHYIISKLII